MLFKWVQKASRREMHCRFMQIDNRQILNLSPYTGIVTKYRYFRLKLSRAKTLFLEQIIPAHMLNVSSVKLKCYMKISKVLLGNPRTPNFPCPSSPAEIEFQVNHRIHSISRTILKVMLEKNCLWFINKKLYLFAITISKKIKFTCPLNDRLVVLKCILD